MKAMHGNGARNDTEADTKDTQSRHEKVRGKEKNDRGTRKRKRRRRRPAPRGRAAWTGAEVAALPIRAKKRRVWAWKRHRRNARRKERGKLDPDLAFYGVPAVEPVLSPLERADKRAQRLGMGPLIDEDLAHLGIPAAYTWHIPITEWNALMKALHGNGMSKGKQKRATGKKAHEQAHFATLNVCGGGLESIEGAMEEIRELREKGSAPIRNTGREATKKLAEIIRYIKE